MTADKKRVWAVSVVLGLGMVVNYIDRGNVAVAAPLIQKELASIPSNSESYSQRSSQRTHCCRSPQAGW